MNAGRRAIIFSEARKKVREIFINLYTSQPLVAWLVTSLIVLQCRTATRAASYEYASWSRAGRVPAPERARVFPRRWVCFGFAERAAGP